MMEKEKNVVAIEFGNQNIPIPYESRNTSDTTYVSWGLDNLYPNFLLDIYGKSAIHSAVVNQKTTYIIGGGLNMGDSMVDNEMMVNASDSMIEFTSKVIKDYLLFNSFAVEVMFNVFGEPVSFIHIPMHKIRMNRSKTKFFYNDDWVLSRKQITYDRYMPNYKQDGTSKIFYFDGYFPSIYNIYATPEYNASIKAIVTDAAISEFNLNNIKNQFSPSNIITFFNGSNVSEQVKKQITDEIETKFKGESGKKFIIDFQHKDGKPAEIRQLSATDWDKAYLEVNNRNIDNIMIGHEVQNPSLFGIKTSGQLGSTSELQASYEMLKNNYVSVKRNEIQSALNQLFTKYTKVTGKLTFIDKPLFQTQISDSLREKIYLIDELRKLDGAEPLPNGEGNRLIGEPIQPVVVEANSQESSEITSTQPNESIKNLSGRQYQNVMRIVRQFTQGKLTKEQANIMLKSGFGFTDDEVDMFLGVNENPITEEEILEFSDVKKKVINKILTEEDYELVKDLGSYETEFEVIEDIVEGKFDKESDISTYLIRDDLRGLSIDEVVKRINERTEYTVDRKDIERYLNKMQDSGLIKWGKTPDGNLSITQNTKTPRIKTGEVSVRYRYVKRPGIEGPTLIPTSRSFCVKLINNNKLYTREDIQTMSSIFGYDVFAFAGGFYHNPDTDTTTSYCRHTWQSVTVRRREQ